MLEHSLNNSMKCSRNKFDLKVIKENQQQVVRSQRKQAVRNQRHNIIVPHVKSPREF